MFISWTRHHGRSEALAAALGLPAEFIATGTHGDVLTLPWRYATQTLRTLWLLLRRRPRVLVVMAPPLPLMVLGLAYRTLRRGALVVDAHTGAVVDDDGRVRRAFVRVARAADVTVVTTEALQRLLADDGVDAIALHDAPVGDIAPPASWPPERPRIVMPSSWWRDEPLEAVRDAARQVPEIELVLTGRPAGPLADASAWPANVRLAGWLSDRDYRDLVASATAILALTTRELTMQRAGYEALILGRPAVVSDTGVLREYFTKGAVFAEPNAASLAAALRAVAAEPEALARDMAELRAEKQLEFERGVAALQATLGRPQMGATSG